MEHPVQDAALTDVQQEIAVAKAALDRIEKQPVWKRITWAAVIILTFLGTVYQYEARLSAAQGRDTEKQVTIDRNRQLYDELLVDHNALLEDYATVYEWCAQADGCLLAGGVTDPTDVTTPDPLPTDTSSVPPATSSTIMMPPSVEQVASAVAAYCAVNERCRGQAGASTTPGDVLAALQDSGLLHGLTTDAAAAAVAAYCAGGACVGAAGTDGATGAPGPPPTADQIAAAVAAYCAGGACTGPQGATGATGPAGADGAPGAPGTDGAPGPAGATGPAGASVVAAACTDPDADLAFTFEFTLSDGTVIGSNAACTPVPPPPDPAPAP